MLETAMQLLKLANTNVPGLHTYCNRWSAVYRQCYKVSLGVGAILMFQKPNKVLSARFAWHWFFSRLIAECSYVYIIAAVALRWYVLSLRLLNQTIAGTLQCVPATVARLHLPLRDLRHAAETLDMRIARHALRSNSTSTTWVCVCVRGRK